MVKAIVYKPLIWIKHGLILAFIFAAALFPLFGFMQIASGLVKQDNRKVVETVPFNARSIDATSANPQLFKEPLITITFDDGRNTVYSQAFPVLQKYGIHSTQYLISGTIDDQAYVSPKQIDQMYKAGHEIACHTVTHRDITTLSAIELTNELTQCQKTFSKYAPVSNFASPYGHTNDKSLDIIKKYYLSHRNTNGDITNGISDKDVNTAQNFDRYNIISAAIRHDTTEEQLRAAVEYTIKNNGWLVLTYHQIEDTENATFGLDPDSLGSQLEYLSRAPVRIVTMKQVVNTLDNKDVAVSPGF